jgi:hypothetical protein
MIIYAPARTLLNEFWLRYPERRSECTRKYGFDPILQEDQYWVPGIAERAHRHIRRDIQANGGVFSVPLVRRWMASELKQR